jgi:hypothetical protein
VLKLKKGLMNAWGHFAEFFVVFFVAEENSPAEFLEFLHAHPSTQMLHAAVSSALRTKQEPRNRYVRP